MVFKRSLSKLMASQKPPFFIFLQHTTRKNINLFLNILHIMYAGTYFMQRGAKASKIRRGEIVWLNMFQIDSWVPKLVQYHGKGKNGFTF
jgi:hypothetical protein